MAAKDYQIGIKDIQKLDSTMSGDINKSEKLYDKMISESEKYTDKQISAVKDYEKKQTDIQNEQTDFAIEKINQQKDQLESDYIKEQSGAYKDWQKQSNPYGANAEAMAAQGMANSGYSESSQVSMYNTYQNRVATAREAYSRAVLNYDNAITEARLQNSSKLAEIAYQSLSKQLELSLSGFQYKNTLIKEKAQVSSDISMDYWTKYKDMLYQINSQEELKIKKEAQKLDEEEFEYEKEQGQKIYGGSTAGSSSGKGGGSRIRTTYKAPVKISNPKVNLTEKSTTKKKTTKEPTVDMNSVLKLGYGPISATKLNNLIKQGKVKETVKNGKLVYTKKFNY
jgi:hypothetical protein